jgi:hypothetical protein
VASLRMLVTLVMLDGMAFPPMPIFVQSISSPSSRYCECIHKGEGGERQVNKVRNGSKRDQRCSRTIRYLHAADDDALLGGDQ